MTMNMRALPALVLSFALVVPAPLVSQTDEDAPTAEDPGFLERIIQNALGGDGREVRIVGLEGALSSDVRISAIEVADVDGTWLTIRDVGMSWRRLALLRRRVEIDALTIGSVDLVRPPVAPPAETPELTVEVEEDPEPPQPFALPELPVSITLGELSVGRVDLGEELTGQAASLSVDGSARLEGGEGGAEIRVVRLDGPEGLISLDAGFENETRRLYVNLDVEEEPDGLIATLAKFPGAPSVDLSVSGDAPISDFTADILLTTDGEERLAGDVSLAETSVDDRTVQTISADIGGDITPLFVPQYREFFGEDVGLQARVRLDPETGTEVETFTLASHALNLNGTASLLPSGLPRLVDVSGNLGAPDGLPIILPLTGPETQVTSGVLRLDYDASEGDDFLAAVALLGFRREDIAVNTVNLDLDGTLQKTDEPLTITEVATAIRATVSGISINDPSFDDAFAPPVTFDANVTYTPDAATVAVRDLALVSGDLRLDGTVDVTELNDAINVAADADLVTGDLARFAALAGQDLQGAFDGAVTAAYTVASGAFDVDFSGAGENLAIGNPQVDPLLAGDAVVALAARRDTGGIALERLEVSTDQVSASGTGQLDSRSAALDLEAALQDAGLLVPQLSGPLTVTAEADGSGTDYTVALVAGGAALTDVLGDPATLNSDISYDGDAGTLGVSDLRLVAGDLNATGRADVTGLNALPAVDAVLDLDTGDLARFATLAGLPLAGSLSADLDAAFDTDGNAFDATITGLGRDIAIGNPQLDQLLSGVTDIDIAAQGDVTAVHIDRLTVKNPALSLSGAGDASLENVDLNIDAALQQVELFVPHLSGPVTLALDATGGDGAYTIALDAGGQAILDALGDDVTLDSDMTYDPDAGTLGVPRLALLAGALSARGTADVSGLNEDPAVTAALDLDTGDLSRLAALSGMPLSGTLRADVDGAYDTATGNFDATVIGQGQSIAIGSPQVDQLLAGATDIDIAAQGEGEKIRIERLNITNPALQVAGGGTIAPEGGAVDLDATLANLGIFVPQVSGPLTLDASAEGAGSEWAIDVNADGPAGIRAAVAGEVAPTNIALDISAGLANLGTFVPGLVGGLDVDGTVRGDGTDYYVDIDATSPTRLSANIDGRAWGPDGTSDLSITAAVPLALADGFIRPRTLTGTMNADLALQGAPGLEALSGTVTIPSARFTDPELKLVLENIALNLGLAQSRANIDLSAQVPTGGRILVSGPVSLEAPNNGDISVVLDALKLVDPQLYEIDMDGRISLAGALTGGAAVNGRINIARAEIKIPGGVGGGGPIPDMVHVAEPGRSHQTREHAGIVKDENSGGGTGAPVAYPLDIVISAPSRIFVRGRGLDVEFGGELDIGGTSARPVPSGRFSLIRGDMDLLGRVLEFSDAEVTLGGDLVPDIYMVATSTNASVESRILIEGPVNDPELEFSSSPALPEDEVLAQLFFGKAVQDLTPIEVAQLLSAINTLTGGGGGLFGALRGGLGVDRLNVGSDTDGNTEVSAGKYITDEVYTDVTVNSEGTSRINLNYDVTPSFTVRGGFSNDGDTRVGITFERDY